uniref:HECT-type E3 ubiquitin transferase n=1 Tax=Tetradesmus obliquus TaxID=3088 RepID=A0A383WLR6_TETOB|eukprot:jgi/Sobl393_1/8728/SZX78109.1
MQAGARYEGGYSAGHTTIAALWSVLLALPVYEKRAFLQFCTGCDRAPVAGLGALRLLLQRAGPDSEKLPTAHTCFNTLLLPEYSSRAKLQRKLMTAIQNAQGFGLQ